MNNKINTIVSDVAITHVVSEEMLNNEPTVLNCVYNPVEELHSAKCPHCGESYYQELYTTTTAVYYPPIYKDGVNINSDRNQSATTCYCLNCKKEFVY